MEKCKVEFIGQTGQKIILDFTIADNGDLDYKPSFEPKLSNPKTNLGLAGQLCEIFITALMNETNEVPTIDNEPEKKSEN